MGSGIRDNLDKMKRKDLAGLGFRLNLPPPGRRGELDSWREAAAEVIPSLGATVRECLGCKGVVRLRRCLEAAGECDGELLVPRALAVAHQAQLTLGTLKKLALCRQDRQSWHVQPVVVGMLAMPRGEKSLLEASDDLYACCRGYLLHFGMLPVATLQEMLLGRRDKEAEGVVLAVWARRCGLEGVVFMEQESVWLCLPELPDPSSLAAEVLRPDRRMIEYAKVSEEQARRAVRDGVTGDEALLARLVEAGKRCGVSKSDMLISASLAERMYQEDDRDMAIETLLMHMDNHRLPVGELLADRYLNTVPVWRVKGHTVQETRQESPQPPVGWNTPCPCGSGRRWGLCCGKGN